VWLVVVCALAYGFSGGQQHLFWQSVAAVVTVGCLFVVVSLVLLLQSACWCSVIGLFHCFCAAAAVCLVCIYSGF
jgi:hypothetical protein